MNQSPWNSLEFISSLNLIVKWAIPVLGITALVLGARESVLKERSSALERRRTNRILTASARQSWVARLSKLPKGFSVDTRAPQSGESAQLAGDIATCLHDCGFSSGKGVIDEGAFKAIFPNVPFVGIIIICKPDSKDRLLEAFTPLFEAVGQTPNIITVESTPGDKDACIFVAPPF
jgi:hypothetical protein